MPLKNPEYISMLNKYYSSSLMFEFSLNNRDMAFIDKVTEVKIFYLLFLFFIYYTGHLFVPFLKLIGKEHVNNRLVYS